MLIFEKLKLIDFFFHFLKRYLDPTRICDGYPDCDGGEDETGCVCQPWEHFCGSQGAKGGSWIYEILKFQDGFHLSSLKIHCQLIHTTKTKIKSTNKAFYKNCCNWLEI